MSKFIAPSAIRASILCAGLGLAVALLLSQPTAGSAQAEDGWISILAPAEWSGERTRGIVVRRRNSVRVEGLAYQPGGVSRVMIDGRQAQLEARSNGQVRFVGYADTDTVARLVEIAAYSAGQSPPVIREFPYTPSAETPVVESPDEVFTRDFRGERYAVVIGISDYADEGIGSLRYADDDAQSFYDFLISDRAGLGGFDPDNVRLLTDEAADTRAVRTALTTFLRGVTERDVVVIYMAGHGAADPFRPDDYYLLTHDTEATNFAGTAVSMNDIEDYVSRLRARDVIVFTDACHSAAVTGGGVGLRAGPVNAINRLFQERLSTTAAGLLTFTASETNQYSQEGTQWGGGHGVFTHQLLRGLRGAADEDQDGIVTLGEVVEYTRFSVQRETQGAQVPFYGPSTWERSWPIAIADPSMVVENVPTGTGPGRGNAAVPVVELISPAGAFTQSLFLPGTGQMRTGHTLRGTLVLAGAVGAVAYGFLTTTVTQQCREALVDGVCVSGQYTGTETERPNLVAGLATAGALTVIGAVDALIGARRINRDRLRAAGVRPQSGASLALFPTEPIRRSRPMDLRLLELRFR